MRRGDTGDRFQIVCAHPGGGVEWTGVVSNDADEIRAALEVAQRLLPDCDWKVVAERPVPFAVGDGYGPEVNLFEGGGGVPGMKMNRDDADALLMKRPYRRVYPHHWRRRMARHY